ncbi:uncharacterized protein LOC108105214 [Drosophila eugracilis]|uniref:uncharacterized protein LOC108105214 n=1 Tax=Drosophila eugracilis TaxID=29029 RepID=UPI001BD97212|nr:uncharacterized protein LOC108105214 [Drosophila eugracilis]
MEQVRAVVQLSDNKSHRKPNQSAGEANIGASAPGREPQPQAEAFQYGGQVSILDGHSLRLLYCQNSSKPHLLMAQKFHFDVLSTQESVVEIPILLNNLFGKRRDGFLMHMRVNRECHLMFLLDTLVIQVRSKLKSEGLSLDHGIVRFRKLLEEEEGNSLQVERAFSDIHGLMLWLLNQYRMRAELSTGPGHEALEVEYMVSSEERRLQFSVRLYILLVATEELSADSMRGLRYYFYDRQISSAVVGTELINFMLHVTQRSRNQNLYFLMLCHVLSTNSEVDAQNAQLLSLAHLVSRRSCLQEDSMPSNCSFAHLNHLDTQQQEIHDRFKLVQASLMQYIQKAEQLKGYRQRFDDQLAQYEELLKQTANSEFNSFIQASQANLHHIHNLVGKK